MEINIKKVKPMFNQIVTTMEMYDDNEMKNGSLIDYKKVQNPIKEYQKVIAVGTTVRNINVGDLVLINPSRYAKLKHQEGSLKDGVISDNPVVKYNFNIVEIDHQRFLLLYDSDITFVIEEYEMEDDSPIIQPVKKEIIV